MQKWMMIGVLLGLPVGVIQAESPSAPIDSSDADRQQAFQLYQQRKMPEAAALLEKVVAKDPSDVAAHEAFGVALLSRASTESDSQRAREDRLGARRELLRAKELGDTSDLCQTLLAQIPESGEVDRLSENPEADTALQAGEAAFAKGNWQEALPAYLRAWDVEHSATAALFIGDTYFSMKDMDRAGEWFAKAIELAPNHENAYRYWGDALMAQGKMKEARLKYIEGIVAAPYDEASITGLHKWLDTNHLSWKEIPITLPPGPSVDDKGKTTITVDVSMLKKPDETAAWLIYSSMRAQFRAEEFSKVFPQEKSYRHSLAEEVSALDGVVLVYGEETGGKHGKRVASIELLAKLKDEEMLEPFVLLTHADAGIAQDYAAYREAHRDRLIGFMDRYLVPPAR